MNHTPQEMKNGIFLYTERGEILDSLHFASLQERNTDKLIASLVEINEQIRLIESITVAEQKEYFIRRHDGRNMVEDAQLGYRSGITTSAEWRKRHLHNTQAEIDEATANWKAIQSL